MYASGSAKGSRSSSGAQWARIASPNGASKWLVPAGASTKLSEIIFSNSRRVRLRGTRPWQWWSMRGTSTSMGIAVPFADLVGTEVGHQLNLLAALEG